MLHLRHKAEIQLLSSATTLCSSAPSSTSQRAADTSQGLFDDHHPDADDDGIGDAGSGPGAGSTAKRGGKLVEYLEERIGAAVARAKEAGAARVAGAGMDELARMQELSSDDDDVEIDWGGSGLGW